MINISSIKNISRVKKCSAGTVITGEGTTNLLFVVVKGEVGVYKGYRKLESELVQTLGSGDLFADPGLLRDQTAAYTSVSLGEAIIIPVEKRYINDFIQDEPALAFELLKELFLRLEPTGRTPAVQPNSPQYSNDGEPHKQDFIFVDSTDTQVFEAAVADLAAEGPSGGMEVPTAPEQAGQAQSKETGKSAFALFPEDHGDYELPLKEQNTAILMNKTYTCPICKTSFTTLAIRQSKLIVAATDPDLRYHYKGIEPLYYEVLTCPNCLFSALQDQFGSPEKSKQDIAKTLAPLKSGVDLSFGLDKSTDSIFAGYYLALHCAPIAFTKFQLVAGKLQYKLSRVYKDAGDEEMENKMALKALDNYLYAYAKIGVPPNQEQQICILIGELYLKQNDLKNAIGFFNRAKSCQGGSQVLKNHAENRAYEIREAAKK